MESPSSFIQLNSLSEDEIYSHPETDYAVSWQGYIDKISKSDIKHLLAGKPLLFVVNDEYNIVIKLDD